MPGRTCPQCGKPLPDHARFCGQCGTVTAPPAMETPAPGAVPIPIATISDPEMSATLAQAMGNIPAGVDATQPATQRPVAAVNPLAATQIDPPPSSDAPQGRGALQQTMLGFAAPKMAPLPAAPATAAATTDPAPAPVAMGRSAPKGTMLGMPAANLPAAPAADPRGAPPQQRTMLGVAIPGIAPTRPGPAPAPAGGRGGLGTMLGVAMPGIAPTGEPDVEAAARPPGPVLRKGVEILPMPPALTDEPMPAAPVVVRKSGVPLGIVAGIVAVLVVVTGGIVALLWKSAPLVAQPRLDAEGHDVLHLTCPSCPDDTAATLDGQHAAFKAHEADLLLAHELVVGENAFTVHIDRPNLGRDEAVSLTVPITYRIRADLADLSAAHPQITVRVQALPGTEVEVDGKPLALDASGAGAYAIDVSSEIEGPADDVKVIDRTIAYSVRTKAGAVEKATIHARVGVVPLRLDAPGMRAVVDTATFHIAGKTTKGATLTANGHAVPVLPDGSFAQPFDAPQAGDLPVEIRASAPPHAPRLLHLVVRRVERLAEEAKAREKGAALGYDAIAADVPAAVGQLTIVAGEVAEARTTNDQTIAVVDDTRGCKRAPCLMRVVSGGEIPVKHGDSIRAYGRVTGAVTAAGGTVPEMEADFVLKTRPGR